MKQLKINPSITSREESMSLEKYLKEIAKMDMVSIDEEIDLTRRIKMWDQQALDKLVNANLRFVVSVAKKYQYIWLSLSDLINEWNIWLIKAAHKFDETRGFKFISYAVRRIRQSIIQAIVEKSRIIKLPWNASNIIAKINKESSAFEQEYEREPTSEEIAEILNMDVSTVQSMQQSHVYHTSLDQPLNTEERFDTSSLWDLISDRSEDIENTLEIENEYASERLKAYFSKMDKREVEVLKMFFGIWYTKSYSIDDIWSQMSLTRERIRQIKSRWLRALKSKIDRDPDSKFLLWVLQR